MTEKEKQIIEMARVRCQCYDKTHEQCMFGGGQCDSNCAWYKYLYNAGVRKVDEKPVVLTREQYQNLRQSIFSSTKVDINYILNQLGVEVNK